MKVDILPCTVSQECDHCGDPWGARFAIQSGICAVPLCFQCILEELETLKFEGIRLEE